MRVAMYYKNNDVRLEEMDVPQIGPGEVLVRVMASGICGSDVLEWYRVKQAPRVLGHEIAGDIVKIGPGVDPKWMGKRVFVSHHIPCNTCHYCLRGYHTACETLHTTNYDPGGFAEYIRIPRLNVDRGIFFLPDEMTYDQGVFVEPLGCVIRAQRIAHLQPGQSVLILGSGISGLLHLLLAQTLGAGTIIVTDVNDFRLKMALDFGANGAIDARSYSPETFRDLNGGRLADLVIVCTGAPSAFDQALQSVDRGGTVLCFATTTPDVKLSVPLNDFWRNEIKLMPSYGNAPIDAVEAIELLKAGRVSIENMITHRFGLENTGLGFKLVASSGDSMKVIIEPHT
jgi:L-iditol 2-dehydrogenase